MSLFDEPKQPNVFEFGVDETAKAYLLQTVRWTKFLAVIGIVMSAILVLLGGFSIFMAGNELAASTASTNGVYTSGLMVFYLALVGLYVYPIIALFRFSSTMKSALAQADVHLFNEALRTQRNFWRYLGILMITVLVLYGIIIIGIIGYFSMGR